MRKWRRLLFLGIFIALAWWILGEPNRLATSMFGPSANVSHSMDGYEIALRNAFWFSDEEPKDPRQFKEWTLTIPRAYLVKEIGENGAIDGPQSAKGNLFLDWFAGRHYGDYFARLDTVLDPQSQELRPAVLADEKELRGSFVALRITNGVLFPRIPIKEYCIRESDVLDFFDANKSKLRGFRVPGSLCQDVMPRCHINTILDGWHIELTVSRSLYNRPDDMCRISRAFLNKYTTKRDQF